jgi:hypothetical protein
MVHIIKPVLVFQANVYLQDLVKLLDRQLDQVSYQNNNQFRKNLGKLLLVAEQDDHY